MREPAVEARLTLVVNATTVHTLVMVLVVHLQHHPTIVANVVTVVMMMTVTGSLTMAQTQVAVVSMT